MCDILLRLFWGCVLAFVFDRTVGRVAFRFVRGYWP